MEYKPSALDYKWAKVRLTSPKEPEFKPIVQGEVINFKENEVLEILQTDGTSFIYTGKEDPSPAYYSVQSIDDGLWRFNLSGSYPLERLWIRSGTGNGISYKIPRMEKDRTGNRFFLLRKSNATIFGDKYFNAAYELREK